MWLRNNAKEDFPWDEDVCCYAARNGYLGVLQGARAQDSPCPWDEGLEIGLVLGGFGESCDDSDSDTDSDSDSDSEG